MDIQERGEMAMFGRFVFGLIVTLVCIANVSASGDVDAQAVPFDKASVRFEHNATDGDVEVVFEVDGGDVGLMNLTVMAPDGRPVVDVAAPDVSTLGIRKFNFESPEPKDVEALKAAYPEGVYTFDGKKITGESLHAESTLDHRLPVPTEILVPHSDAANVSPEGLVVTWKPVPDAISYVVEIDQDELNFGFRVRLPGSSATLAVPSGILVPATEYELSIGTVSARGNISVTESKFTTTE